MRGIQARAVGMAERPPPTQLDQGGAMWDGVSDNFAWITIDDD